ncbi:MAG: prepilin-type N-terminal cleavage/methylation domain-containing protein [Terriglobales bacterium]
MSKYSTKRKGGFTLLEMVIAMALGLIVLAAAVQVYIQGLHASWTVSQRAELQQDFRAASNMLTRDLSLAGAGLNPGTAIALPSGSTPEYGCDQSTCRLNGVAGTYPVHNGTPYLYGLIPGYNLGPTLLAAQGATDVVTVVYTDSSFYLNCYVPSVTTAGKVTFSQPTPATPLTWTTDGCLPSGVATPQAVNDAAVGLTTGDLVMMTLGGTTVVVEVTGAVTTGTDANGHTNYSVPFANGDALKMNQTASGYLLNGIQHSVTGAYSSAPCGGTGPCRLLVITYYIDNTTTPPRLMRQVSGHSPIPVAENLAYLKFSYDLFNSATNTPAVGCSSPGASADGCNGASSGLLPNQITKINILNMAIDSSLWSAVGNGYQSLALQTSVSARNLTYTNNYPN